MRIGIYGGSFNPIHNGHTALADYIVSQGIIDEIWLMVSPLNPLKESCASTIASYADRLEMATLATEDLKGIKVSDFENTLPRPSYTFHTLAELEHAHPEHTFSLVIGADNWQSFEKWYKHDEIADKHDIIIYKRPGCDIDQSALPKRVTLLDAPTYDISSTEIRERIKQKLDIHPYVSPKVEAYIKKQNLYQN